MRSKSVAWSTLTNSASQFFKSSAGCAGAFPPPASTGFAARTWLLQYSMTFERISESMLGSVIPFLAQSSSSSSIMWRIVLDTPWPRLPRLETRRRPRTWAWSSSSSRRRPRPPSVGVDRDWGETLGWLVGWDRCTDVEDEEAGYLYGTRVVWIRRLRA